MFKILKYSLIFLGFLIVLNLFLYFTKFCPPPGPWPKPPWCDTEYYNQNNNKKTKTTTSFNYQKLNYIDDNIKNNHKNIDLIIGTMDIWGNPHLFLDLGEDSRKHVTSTLQRISKLGANGFYLTDFIGLNKNLDLVNGEKGAQTINVNELKNIVKIAKQNHQEKIFLVTNLYEISQALKNYLGNKDQDNAIDKLIKQQNHRDWKLLLTNWETYLNKQSQKAEQAGITHLIVNAWDFGFDNFKDKKLLNQELQNYLTIAKNNFNGQVGLIIFYPQLKDINQLTLNQADFIVIFWDPNADYIAKNIFKNTNKNLESIENAFTNWFKQFNWQKLNNLDIYLGVTMPSYETARQNGWIEPGAKYGPEYKKDYQEQALVYEALFRTLNNNNFPIKGVISYGYWWTNRIYPQVKVLRNDLSHSIRKKDAENIFYKWSQIFNH